eukprot:15461486-Alexandrium_andersonii.AAC.1
MSGSRQSGSPPRGETARGPRPSSRNRYLREGPGSGATAVHLGRLSLCRRGTPRLRVHPPAPLFLPGRNSNHGQPDGARAASPTPRQGRSGG